LHVQFEYWKRHQCLLSGAPLALALPLTLPLALALALSLALSLSLSLSLDRMCLRHVSRLECAQQCVYMRRLPLHYRPRKRENRRQRLAIAQALQQGGWVERGRDELGREGGKKS
jgi:hypothetical protein